MDELIERFVEVNGYPCRVWEKGKGKRLGYLAGIVGLPKWTTFLNCLAKHRRVIVPSLPGFPGAEGHFELDSLMDWVSVTIELIDAAGLEGADLVGASVGGALAAEVAALARSQPFKLVLISPFGIFDETEPVLDLWAQLPGAQHQQLCKNQEMVEQLIENPEGEDVVEWQIQISRANEAAARLLWPLCDTGIRKRLRHIHGPTLLIWGSEDKVLPVNYAQRFAEGIVGKTRIQLIEGAGHLADLDAPDAVYEAILDFLG